jgi:hypothetical protein
MEMNKTIEKIVLFFPFLIVFQLVFADITALIYPIISTGTLDLEKWADRMNTTFFMGLWVVVWVYPILYGFFIFSQKSISPGWQILSHSLIALVFIFLFGNNFGGFFILGIPLLTTTSLNYFFLKKVFD